MSVLEEYCGGCRARGVTGGAGRGACAGGASADTDGPTRRASSPASGCTGASVSAGSRADTLAKLALGLNELTLTESGKAAGDRPAAPGRASL